MPAPAIYYGLNALSNNMIMADRKRLRTPNGVILGTPGSGKSFSAKREILSCFLMTRDDVIICDPEGEYFALVGALHGQVVRLATNSKDYLTKEKKCLSKSILYYGVILCFIIGAVLGNVCISYMQEKAILVCAFFLLAAFIMMFIDREKEEHESRS